MLLKQFRVHVIDELAYLLDEVPSKGWRKLMRKGFDFYGEEDFMEIKDAWTLLKDLMGRDTTAEDLIEAVGKIANTKAEALVKKEMEESLTVPIQDSGGLSSTRYDIQPLEEPSSPSMERSRYQAETFPKTKGDHPAPGVDCATIVYQVFQPFIQCIYPPN